jgi:protease-4
MALSGGYYMAIAGDKLYATSGANVGNVGALTIRPFDPQIWPGLLSTGPYKLSGGSRFDQVQQLELSKEAFVSSVIAHRSQSAYNPLRIDARTLAEAHIYLGSEGLAIGLVDAQGSRSDAIIAAGELAGVKDYQVVELSDYLGLPFEPSLDVFSLIEGALPGTVFFLDSRIPLAADVRDKLTRHALYPIGSERQAPTPNHEGSR